VRWTNCLRFIAADAITAINWSLYSLQHQWHIAVAVAVAIAVNQSLWALHCRPEVFGRRFAVENDETEPLSRRQFNVPDWLGNCGGQVRQCTGNGLDHVVARMQRRDKDPFLNRQNEHHGEQRFSAEILKKPTLLNVLIHLARLSFGIRAQVSKARGGSLKQPGM
jgi:hypothetical protein